MNQCILFSGGWDSAAIAVMNLKTKPDLLFVNYGQKYFENEADAALKFAKYFGMTLIMISLPLEHDHPRRNFYLISEAKRLGYDEIFIGCRNLFPFMDKYKDSNWFSVKLFGWLMGVKIRTPIAGWMKRRVLTKVMGVYPDLLYNCYSNLNDFKKCTCQNCTEFKKLTIEEES
jgi:hypothetical protein